MGFWDILGIEPTTDTAVIKRAYARQLKLHHPEDDPEGFQQLREAYETALRQQKYVLNVMTRPVVIEQPQVIQPDAAYYKAEEQDAAADRLIADFMDRVIELCRQADLPKNVIQWEKLLGDEVFWSLAIKDKLNYKMLYFLQEQYESAALRLSPHVWKLLNEHFFWTEQQKRLYLFFPEKFLDYVIENIYAGQSISPAASSKTRYPECILPIAGLAMLVVALVKLHYSPMQFSTSSFTTLAIVLISGLFLGNNINCKSAKTLERLGFFDTIIPYCSYYNKNLKYIPLLWYFDVKKYGNQYNKRKVANALFIEILTGLVLLVTTIIINNGVLVFKFVIVFCLMLLITVIESISQSILDKLSLRLAIAGFITSLLLGQPNIWELFIVVVAASWVIMLLRLVKKENISGGIIKLAAAIVIILGVKLALAAFLLTGLGLLIIGSTLLTIESWLLVVKGGFSVGLGGFLFFKMLIGIGTLSGWKTALLVFGIWFIGLFAMEIRASLQTREKTIPLAPVLMAATYITMLYQEALTQIFSF